MPTVDAEPPGEAAVDPPVLELFEAKMLAQAASQSSAMFSRPVSDAKLAQLVDDWAQQNPFPSAVSMFEFGPPAPITKSPKTATQELALESGGGPQVTHPVLVV